MIVVKLELSDSEVKDLLLLKNSSKSLTLEKILGEIYLQTFDIVSECDRVQMLFEEK